MRQERKIEHNIIKDNNEEREREEKEEFFSSSSTMASILSVPFPIQYQQFEQATEEFFFQLNHVVDEKSRGI